MMRAAVLLTCTVLAAACTTPSLPGPSADTVAPTPKRLAGSWELLQVGRIAAPRALSASFNANGQVTGAISCNAWSGRYALDGNRIEFSGDIIVTTAGCGPNYQSLELTARAEESFWHNRAAWLSTDGTRLFMQGDDILTFRRVD